MITKIWTKTRVPFSYSCAFKIFSQLKEVGFEIETMLDFGCGIGPGLWAATDLWPDSIRMYDGVDKSYHQENGIRGLLRIRIILYSSAIYGQTTIRY